MNLDNLLTKKKSAIMGRWFDLVIETYPSETAKFFKGQKNPFANPVGSTILQGIEGLFEEIIQGVDIESEKISTFLDNIIRIRAVQDFSPSQAVSFIFLLKQIIREELREEIRDNKISEELLDLESKIDNLALLSFNIYMECREKINKFKAMEMQQRTFNLLKRHNLIIDLNEQEAEKTNENIS